MSDLTGNARKAKLGLGAVLAISAIPTLVAGAFDPQAHFTTGNENVAPMYNQTTDSHQSLKQKVTEAAYHAVHGDVQLQVQGDLKNDNSVIRVIDSRNPSNFMLIKNATPASNLKEYVEGKPDVETLDFYNNGKDKDNHSHLSYAYTKDPHQVKAIKAVMSPDMPDAVYEGMLETAQKIAADHGANLQLLDCQQTYNHIAGVKMVDTGQKVPSNEVDRLGDPIQGDVDRAIVMPISHHQFEMAQKSHDPNTFYKYGDGIDTSRIDDSWMESMVDATLYKNDGAKLEQPQYNSNEPSVNVTVHNDTVEFGGPGR